MLKNMKKIFSTVTLSSTNSSLQRPYKYLTHGRGTCKVIKNHKKRTFGQKATSVYDEIVDAPEAGTSAIHEWRQICAHVLLAKKHLTTNSPRIGKIAHSFWPKIIDFSTYKRRTYNGGRIASPL